MRGSGGVGIAFSNRSFDAQERRGTQNVPGSPFAIYEISTEVMRSKQHEGSGVTIGTAEKTSPYATLNTTTKVTVGIAGGGDQWGIFPIDAKQWGYGDTDTRGSQLSRE